MLNTSCYYLLLLSSSIIFLFPCYFLLSFVSLSLKRFHFKHILAFDFFLSVLRVYVVRSSLCATVKEFYFYKKLIKNWIESYSEIRKMHELYYTYTLLIICREFHHLVAMTPFTQQSEAVHIFRNDQKEKNDSHAVFTEIFPVSVRIVLKTWQHFFSFRKSIHNIPLKIAKFCHWSSRAQLSTAKNSWNRLTSDITCVTEIN